MTSAAAQLRALVRLRWQMVRSPRTRMGLLLLAGLGLLALVAAGLGGAYAPRRHAFNIAIVTPTAFLGFAVLAILSPLFAGGGNQLFPPEQLAPYPVRPATTFLASVAVAPLNIAWAVQVVSLAGLTGFVVGPDGRAGLAFAVTALYVVAATLVGQALGWLAAGIRLRAAGRRVLWALGAALVGGTLAVFEAHVQYVVLDRVPTTPLVLAMIGVGAGHYGRWAIALLALVLVAALAGVAGVAACDWTLRRSGDSGVQRDARTVARRRPRRSVSAELVAVERASVWRCPPLRRGVLVLALVPAVVAAGAGVSARSLILVPGLVSSAAGLLYGVNAFCLDGSGAVWLASLPHDHLVRLRARMRVLAETCYGATLIAVVAGSLRSPHAPTGGELAGLAASTLVCPAAVVATCLRLSLTRPHRADLRGPRDTPAPPGTMATYSARLALVTTVTAIVFMAMSAVGAVAVPLLVGLLLWLRAVWSILRSERLWADPAVRARVAVTVAYG